MQQIRYFDSAWNDIKHTPGWFGKMCLLALISLIPIFGAIVLGGYLYGWAREMAWGVHEPMPEKIFGNEDGKLYRRGFYLLVFDIVLALILAAILGIVGLIPGMAATSTLSGYGDMGITFVNYSVVYYIIYIALIIVQSFALWIGSMRISIYDRLSSGFQFSKMWAMYKHEPMGLWKIFGMQLIVGLVIGFVLSIVFTFALSGALIGAVSAVGLTVSDYSNAEAVMRLFMAAGPAFIVILLIMIYVFMVAGVFLETLAARALGYWTMQFEVPRWRGQDEPMPFEEGSTFV